jgi:hypothetical protein
VKIGSASLLTPPVDSDRHSGWNYPTELRLRTPLYCRCGSRSFFQTVNVTVRAAIGSLNKLKAFPKRALISRIEGIVVGVYEYDDPGIFKHQRHLRSKSRCLSDDPDIARRHHQRVGVTNLIGNQNERVAVGILRSHNGMERFIRMLCDSIFEPIAIFRIVCAPGAYPRITL